MGFFLLGVLVGAVAVWALLWRRAPVLQREETAGELPQQHAVTRRITGQKGNLAKLREHVAAKETVTNDEVERLLGVSDATATRYLEELEQEGLLRQVGAEGSGVHYKR